MNFKKLTAIVLTASSALLLSQCSNPSSVASDDKEARSFGNLSSDLLIELPPSIAKEPSSGALAKQAATTNLPGDIYEPIRAYIGFANFLVKSRLPAVIVIISMIHQI